MALKVPMDPDDLEELRDFVRAQVRGFAELDEIPAMAIEYMDGSAEVSEELARTLVDSEVATLRAEEPTWPRPTDNDRLDAAFSALRAGGTSWSTASSTPRPPSSGSGGCCRSASRGAATSSSSSTRRGPSRISSSA